MIRATTATVGPDEAGQRLDRWLRRRYTNLTQSRIERMCRKGEIRADGRRVKPSARLAESQIVRLPPSLIASAAPRGRSVRPQISEADAKAMQDAVVYRDQYILAINKPPGLAVQGGTRQHRHLDDLSVALKFDADEPPRLVHRLDKDTSGILLMARGIPAARALGEMFRSHRIDKSYRAVVIGIPEPASGTISIALAKVGEGEHRRMVGVEPRHDGDKAGFKWASTRYAMLGQSGDQAALLELSPLTGRTHQLRAHMEAIGHPILGDSKYGGESVIQNRLGQSESLHLHAFTLEFDHPFLGRRLRLEAPPPPHFRTTCRNLGLVEERL